MGTSQHQDPSLRRNRPVSSLIILGILFVSAVVTSILFSMVTALLIMFGIEEQGGDPGSPAIMFASLLIVCGALNLLTAMVMFVAKEEYRKTCPATWSAILFVVMYLPLHLSEWLPGSVFDGGEQVFTILLFASSIPLFRKIVRSGQNISNLNFHSMDEHHLKSWIVKVSGKTEKRHMPFALRCIG